ncbi:MAG: non-canonical purine NTP pyrophosphatase, partial [Caldilineaceae bacterium]|nr:non-canonical purine NTP pyrophosphatase [Caldilineaceae bacterium]
EVKMELLLATSNPHKARSIQMFLERPVGHVTLALPEIQAVDVTEVIEGAIARQPRGHRGFGWDPIFIPAGGQKTYAEMTLEENAAFSMRRLAVVKLRDFLNSQGL